VIDYLSGPMVVQAIPTYSLALRVCLYEPRFIDKDSWIALTHTQIIHSQLNNFTIKSSSPLHILFNQTLQPKTLLRWLTFSYLSHHANSLSSLKHNVSSSSCLASIPTRVPPKPPSNSPRITSLSVKFFETLQPNYCSSSGN
jgi:hypothetical protein